MNEGPSLLQGLVDNSSDAAIAISPEGKVIFWSKGAERMFGYASDDAVGRDHNDLIVPPGRVDEERRIFQQAVETGPATYESRRRRKDGAELPVEIRLSALETEEGTLVMSAIRDVTEHREAEQALQTANAELEAFAYSIAHDLHAPLRAIDGFSQAVLEDFGPQLPEQAQHYLRSLREGAQRMGELIDDLLCFSRLSRQPLSTQTLDHGKLVQAALEELGARQEGRKVEIYVADLPPCQGDPALLKQVWLNLLSNALKYSRRRETPIIEVGRISQGGECVYFVRDNGVGFDMRYAHKLFGVFQRLHHRDEYEGTGAGLAIVQRIVHRHGGRVWAEAEVDRGATFYFTLKGGNQP